MGSWCTYISQLSTVQIKYSALPINRTFKGNQEKFGRSSKLSGVGGLRDEQCG